MRRRTLNFRSKATATAKMSTTKAPLPMPRLCAAPLLYAPCIFHSTTCARSRVISICVSCDSTKVATKVLGPRSSCPRRKYVPCCVRPSQPPNNIPCPLPKGAVENHPPFFFLEYSRKKDQWGRVVIPSLPRRRSRRPRHYPICAAWATEAIPLADFWLSPFRRKAALCADRILDEQAGGRYQVFIAVLLFVSVADASDYPFFLGPEGFGDPNDRTKRVLVRVSLWTSVSQRKGVSGIELDYLPCAHHVEHPALLASGTETAKHAERPRFPRTTSPRRVAL